MIINNAVRASEIFMKRVEKIPEAGCWIWLGISRRKGYGNFYVEGHLRQAHRVSYELFVGPIPEGLHVLHRCDVPACVNPGHLWVGTNADNVKDKITKGRASALKGVSHSMAKLSEQAVLEIRKTKGSCRKVGEMFGISSSQVLRIRKGESWSHIVGEVALSASEWKPVKKEKIQRFKKYFEFEGRSMIVADWARVAGIDRGVLGLRIKMGWSMSEALTRPVGPDGKLKTRKT